jgi:hypothetical protein
MTTVAEWENLDSDKLAHLFDNYYLELEIIQRESARYFTKKK